MAAQNEQLQPQGPQVIERPERTRARSIFSPRADVYETSDAIVVVADMPGVDENGVNLTLEKNVLTIRGDVATPQRDGQRLTYTEWEDGDYERSFVLSEGVDRDGIGATVKNGVLRLTLPKAREAMARKIPVKAG
ncbi:MAG: Hsp20/alpha crystallin family protein [Candidatus Latescibacterota bacterium]|jgi:HSP20 family molecular chaperone IbpA